MLVLGFIGLIARLILCSPSALEDEPRKVPPQPKKGLFR